MFGLGWEQVFAWFKFFFIWGVSIHLGQFLGKVSFQNLGKYYNCSEFLNPQRRFQLFQGGSAWQGHPGDASGLKAVVDLTISQGMWYGHL